MKSATKTLFFYIIEDFIIIEVVLTLQIQWLGYIYRYVNSTHLYNINYNIGVELVYKI